MKRTFVVLFCLLLSSALSALAQVSSVSGSVEDGRTIIVTGSGFGSIGPDISLFDDFESGAVGQHVPTGPGSAPIGQWDVADGHVTPTYVSDFKVSGNTAISASCSATDGQFEAVQRRLPGFPGSSTTREIFISYWYYVPAGTEWAGGNWKRFWVMGQNNSAGIGDMTFPSHSNPTINDGHWFCNGCAFNSWFQTSATYGKWMRFWGWVKARADNTGEVKGWEIPNDLGTQMVKTNSIGVQVSNSATDRYSAVNVNGYTRVVPGCALHFDDIYIAIGASAQARVELSNRRNYVDNTATNITLCTPVSWGDASVNCTVRQGSFVSGQVAYLFVIDSDGNVSDQDPATPGAQGFEVRIGNSSGDVTPPAAPRNVRVMP